MSSTKGNKMKNFKTEKTVQIVSVKESEVDSFVKNHKNCKVSNTKNAFGRFEVTFETEGFARDVKAENWWKSVGQRAWNK